MRGGGCSDLGLGMRAWALAGALLAGPAWPQDPLATRAGWELGGQLAQYRYEEPGLMELEGPRLGVSVAWSATTPRRAFARLEGRFSYGALDYRGSGTLTDVPDYLLEGRLLAGRDYGDDRLRWSPYVGGGVRYLYNDLRGVSSSGAIGYRRESTYFYVPLGVTLRARLAAGWVLAPLIEYDAFVRGTQRSYLSDTGLGLGDVTNRQSRGRGWRATLMFESRRWSVGPWLHFWDVDDSDLQPVAPGIAVYEPANETREAGVELRYRF